MIITSATIDTERFAKHFGRDEDHPAPIIQVSGRTYPVEVRYRAIEDDDSNDDNCLLYTSGFFTGLDLIADIDLARRIFAHEDDCEPRAVAVLSFELGNLYLHIGADFCGERLAVNQFCCHSFSVCSVMCGLLGGLGSIEEFGRLRRVHHDTHKIRNGTRICLIHDARAVSFNRLD